jgi:diguanylate cyclase (GGDEF)-like protein
VEVLGNPYLLIVPKLVNVAAGCVVLGLLLLRWLPAAVKEHSQSERHVDDLKVLAAIDPLTGLYNRRQFEAIAGSEWARFQRYLRPLSILIIDIDHFKSINDRFGHAAGDNVLTGVATICDSARRQSDTVARIGGEEFALLMPETTETAARIVAERLCKQVREYLLPMGDEEVMLTVSIGIASASLSMSGIATLMKRADDALYEAKHSGRDRVSQSSIADSSFLVAAA